MNKLMRKKIEKHLEYIPLYIIYQIFQTIQVANFCLQNLIFGHKFKYFFSQVDSKGQNISYIGKIECILFFFISCIILKYYWLYLVQFLSNHVIFLKYLIFSSYLLLSISFY